jgi:hypothetical protein
MSATNPISPKVIAATAAAVVVPALLAVGTYVLANQDVLGINNPVLGVFVVALITGAVTFLSGYVKADPLRQGRTAAGRTVTARDANGDGRDDTTGRFV